MKKPLLVLSLMLASFALSGCIIEERFTRSGHGPGYYGDRDDFYYTSGRPYSRSYGVLTVRDGHHYYRRGGRYVTYDRPTYAYRGPTHRVQTRTIVRDRNYRDDRTYYRGRRDRNDVYERRNVRVRL